MKHFMTFRLSVVSRFVPALHVRCASWFETAASSEALGTHAVRLIPESHRSQSGRGNEVLEGRVYKGYGPRQGMEDV